MNVSDIWQLGAQIIHAQSTHADGLSTDASLASDLCGVEWEAWRTLLRPPMLPPDLSHLQPVAGKHFRRAAVLLLGYDVVTKISQNKRVRQRLTLRGTKPSWRPL
jgi:hypothetical protein